MLVVTPCQRVAKTTEKNSTSQRVGDAVIQAVATAVLHGATLKQALAPHGVSIGEWESAMDDPERERLYDAAMCNMVLEYGRSAGQYRALDLLERRLPHIWGKIDRSEVSGSVKVDLVAGVSPDVLELARQYARRRLKS